jgi:hypothetical protein
MARVTAIRRRKEAHATQTMKLIFSRRTGGKGREEVWRNLSNEVRGTWRRAANERDKRSLAPVYGRMVVWSTRSEAIGAIFECEFKVLLQPVNLWQLAHADKRLEIKLKRE